MKNIFTLIFLILISPFAIMVDAANRFFNRILPAETREEELYQEP